MNDWVVEQMNRSRRDAVQDEMAEIRLGDLAEEGKSQPVLFRLGNGLIALGHSLRKRSAPRRKDYWAVQNELRAEHR